SSSSRRTYDLRHRFYPRLSSIKIPPYTHLPPLSLHDALPISARAGGAAWSAARSPAAPAPPAPCSSPSSRSARSPPRSASWATRDRKSTRLNSSHVKISYAVFCLKKKNTKQRSKTHTTEPH